MFILEGVKIMERQEEYELRQVLFSEINKDIDNKFQMVYKKVSHDFGKEILYPLSIVEKKFNDMSMKSLNSGLFVDNELMISVNPLREAVFWYIKRIMKNTGKLRYQRVIFGEQLPGEDEFIEWVLGIYDEYSRAKLIKSIRDGASKVEIREEKNGNLGFYFPVIKDEYSKEMIYYYGLDDLLASEEERGIFTECEKYLLDKINVFTLPQNPQLIGTYFNTLRRMTSVIDLKYFELCKERILVDLNKISSSTLKSRYKDTEENVINSKEELASFLALFYYLSRVDSVKRMLTFTTNYGDGKYYCVYELPKLLALGKQVGLSNDVMKVYIKYFAIDPRIQGGSFIEFPFIVCREKIVWIPSSIVLNDFQFSIVNGHYYKDVDFYEKDDTVSQSIVDYVVKHSKKYKNILVKSNYLYHERDQKFNDKDLKSDIDVAIYDIKREKLLILECKWKENVYLNHDDYLQIEDAIRKVYSKQLEKHEYYLGLGKDKISRLFDNEIDFNKITNLDILYLFVDKRIQFHDNTKNRHALPIFLLAHLFEKYSTEDELDLHELFEDIRRMESKVKREKVKLLNPVKIGKYIVE